jgi:hypothetical protein
MTHTFGYLTLDQTQYDASEKAEQKNPPELPIGRFLKSKSLGGNRVILVVLLQYIMTKTIAIRLDDSRQYYSLLEPPEGVQILTPMPMLRKGLRSNR